jgi:hypothetical protein
VELKIAQEVGLEVSALNGGRKVALPTLSQEGLDLAGFRDMIGTMGGHCEGNEMSRQLNK